jgi:hypothetical protein
MVGILNLPIVLVASRLDMRLSVFISGYFLMTLFGTFQYYWAAQKATNMNWRRRAVYFPLFLGASIGMGVNNTRAALEGLLGKKSGFERTPKYNLIGRFRNWRDKKYRSPVTWSTAVELVLGLYTLATIGVAIRLQEWGGLPFLCLFAFGYLMVGFYSLKHMAFSRAGRDADGGGSRSPRRVRSRAGRLRRDPVGGTLLLVGVGLLLVSCGQGHAGQKRLAAVRADQVALAVAVPAHRPVGFEELDLAQKDSTWNIIPPEQGGAWGIFWYRPRGSSFDWFVRAQDLTPDRVYRLLLTVDGKIYAIASLLADSRGLLRGYGSLDSFRELICVSRKDWDTPTSLEGTHQFGVWIQDDGTKLSSHGKSAGLPTRPVGREKLPCAGNGDGAFDLRLTELSPARFHGT